MIPFFYTRYKNAPLATFISILSSCFFAGAVILVVTTVFDWKAAQEGGTIGEIFGCAAAFIVLGFLLRKAAEALAKRKIRKLVEKEAERAASDAKVSSYASSASAVRVCPKCSGKVEDGDIFCMNCGAKL